MKKTHLFLIIFSGLLGVGCVASSGGDKNQETIPVSVMSFNIRYATTKDGENQWVNRKELVCSVIRKYSPDVIGLQEALRGQLNDLRKALPEYDEIGVGRSGGKEGEFSAILYRRERFDVDQSGTFWLSNTPAKPSRDWGSACNRICTWARLTDNKANHSFYLYNTHLDHKSQAAREKGLRLIVSRIQERTHPDPFILTGDLNAGETNPAILYLKGTGLTKDNSPIPLVDTFRVLHPNTKEVGTLNGFRGLTNGNKIDYIFVAPATQVLDASIVRTEKQGRYPSDHFPVTATLRFESGRDKSLAFTKGAMSSEFKVEQSLNIAEVPAGFPVGFCLLTDGTTQYVAYYDKERRMTVASRSLDSDKWQYQVLPTQVGWDSHNYITMAVDEELALHVSGNMHTDPLIYFRTEKPGDISTLQQFPMVGENEKRCTYPKFMRDADNRLIFHYRDGGSGNGSEIYNVYDLQTKTWKRLMDKPMVDGQGKMNAYINGPTRGPDGWFHMHWVWRDSPDCATNHHLSYARSRNMLDWESVFGDKVALPITLSDKALWVDPIPSGGGIINGAHKLFFGADKNPIITYHKSDAEGNMQIYAARPEGGEWKRRVLTDWDQPIEFSGGGSMGFIGIRISELSQLEPGIVTMTYRHRDYGTGRLIIDETTLSPMDTEIKIEPEYPETLNNVQSDFPGMKIRRALDIGHSKEEGVRYLLQWETLATNRDRPRKPPLPKPSMLRLYKLSANGEAEGANQAQ